MFSKATAKFVRQIDPDGSLIHVSRLNNSHKLVPMAVVVKRNRMWFWQRPKYQPTDFTLSDLLLGDEPLNSVVSDTEFLTYQGTFGETLRGKLNTKTGSVQVNVEGYGSSKLQSLFGKLKKEELDVKRLLRDSNDRLVDMRHRLVQQLEKRAEVLAVLKERILTTSPCSITETQQDQCNCLGVLGLRRKLGTTVKVYVKDSGSIQVESDVSLEIPPGTVIAYSILELEIKKDGQYELCLQPGTLGGFGTDSGTSSPSHDSFDNMCEVDGMELSGEKVPEKALLSALQNESQELEIYLSPLVELPHSARCALFLRLHETLGDRTALSYLENLLEDWCRGEVLIMADQDELSASQTTSVSSILDLLRLSPDDSSENSGSAVPAYLSAAHLLVSAIEVLPDETLSLLSECSPDFLDAFDTLLFRLKTSHQPLSLDSLPIILQGNEAFQLAEQLLASTNVVLRREADTLQAEMGDKPGVLPLVLCQSRDGGGFGNRVWVNPSQRSGGAGGSYIQPSTFSSHNGGDWGQGGGGGNWGGGGGGRRDNVKSSEFSFSTQNRFSALGGSSNFNKGGREGGGGGGDDDKALLETVKMDMDVWETSGQWGFSCYYFKTLISGFSDLSPEELRLEYYSTRATGDLQSYVNGINQLLNKWRSRVQELKIMNAATRAALLAEINNPASQASSSGFGSTAQTGFGLSTSGFGTGGFGASAPAQASTFSFAAPSGGFGSAAALASSTGFDSAVSTQPASGFGSSATSFSFAAPAANKAGFGSAGAVSTQPPSGFGSSSAPSASSFSFATNQPPASSGFGSASGFSFSSTANTGGGFGSSLGAEASTSAGSSSTGGSVGGTADSLFTPQSKLTPEELNQFKAKRFTLGQIPSKAPPADMLLD
ncbi:hypothetical protein LDENG_00174960 [Lucifuga dentata]|nr:hypothetical protein LDENG_00174960 [Lucifuga dentata]